MKIFFISFFFLITYTLVFAQNYQFKEELHCAHAQQYKNSILASKEIDQTPLLHNYDVKFYHLDLNIEDTTVYISGSVSIQAHVTVPVLDTFAFELLNDLTIDSVRIENEILDVLHVNDEAFVSLNNPLTENTLFTATIFYHGYPPTGGFFSGITSVYDSSWNKNVTWTLSEPFNARHWWPTKQVLTDKADSVWIFLSTSNDNLAGSNGLLTDEEPLANNRIRYEWKSNYPIAYYLISFAVAQYQEYNIYSKPEVLQGDSVFIQNYIYDSPGCLEYYKDGIDNTIELLDTFSHYYTLYPFYKEKYGHCLTALSGGMEHQTMTTLGAFGLGLVSHELGHMWFGDNVTCKTWSDIWINEGFATYTTYLAYEKISQNIWSQVWLNQVHTRVLSEPDGSVYIPPEEIDYDNIERIFDKRLSYYKGALLVHMIRYELQNDEIFFQVLQTFQQEFADSLATGLDFMNVLNQVSGQDFTAFFDQWYFGEGYPILSVNWAQQDDQFELIIIQNTSAPDVTPIFKMHVPYQLYFSDGTDTTLRIWHEGSETNYTQTIEKSIDSVLIDPELWVLNKVSGINGIGESLKNLKFNLFPNPAQQKITLSFFNSFKEVKSISIYSISGKMVSEVHSSEQVLSLDISKYNPGIYIITISNGNESFSQKFIKQE